MYLLTLFLVFFSPGFDVYFLIASQDWEERLRYDLFCVEWDYGTLNLSSINQPSYVVNIVTDCWKYAHGDLIS